MLLGAGVETTRTVTADVSTFIIDGLQSDSAYSVLVSALIGSREGTPAALTVRTGTKLNLPNAYFCSSLECVLAYCTKYNNWDYANAQGLTHILCLDWQNQISLWSGL